MATFDDANGTWTAAATRCLEARVKYEAAYGAAILAADAKTAEARKAQADLASLTEWKAWKQADIDALAAWNVVQYLLPAAPRPVLA